MYIVIRDNNLLGNKITNRYWIDLVGIEIINKDEWDDARLETIPRPLFFRWFGPYDNRVCLAAPLGV